MKFPIAERLIVCFDRDQGPAFVFHELCIEVYVTLYVFIHQYSFACSKRPTRLPCKTSVARIVCVRSYTARIELGFKNLGTWAWFMHKLNFIKIELACELWAKLKTKLIKMRKLETGFYKRIKLSITFSMLIYEAKWLLT